LIFSTVDQYIFCRESGVADGDAREAVEEDGEVTGSGAAAVSADSEASSARHNREKAIVTGGDGQQHARDLLVVGGKATARGGGVCRLPWLVRHERGLEHCQHWARRQAPNASHDHDRARYGLLLHDLHLEPLLRRANWKGASSAPAA
jgi:hypothetical protein